MLDELGKPWAPLQSQLDFVCFAPGVGIRQWVLV